MKFAEHLAAHITPEWNSQYIRYDEMKDVLYALEQDAPIDDENQFKRYIIKVDEQFFQRCDQELAKINTFFAEKLAEAQRKFEALKNELDIEPKKESKYYVQPAMENGNGIGSGTGEAVGGGGVGVGAISSTDSTSNLKSIKDDDLTRRTTFAKRLIEKNRQRQVKQRQYKKQHDLKLAFSEFYLSLILLQNYQSLNFTGFRKILKKHDKLFKTESGNEWRKANVDAALFYTNKRVDTLITETENLFTQYLEGGNRQRAMKRLRVPPFEEKQNPWTTFRLGLLAGMLCVMCPALICIVILLQKNAPLPFNWKVVIRLYRGTLFAIIHIFFIGLNIYGWSSSGVNHVLIFEIDPRNHLAHQDLLEISVFLGVLWIMNLIAFVISSFYQIEHYAYPIAFIAFLVLYLVNPIRIFQQNSRFWFLRVLWRVLSAPFHHVGFADFWLADQLTSFEFIFLDIQYMFCWYLMEADWAPFKGDYHSPCSPRDSRDFTNPYNVIAMLVICVPAWIRFCQCCRRYVDTRNKFPHLANALKYATFFFDTGALVLRYNYSKYYNHRDYENPFFYLWIFVRVITTSYKLWWDYKMDWGFFDKDAGENKYLREVCVYSSKGYYYFAIVEDFVLRFAWLIRLYDLRMDRSSETYKDIVITILSFCEVFRRFVWNFFRLENEHLNNCGQFRAVRDISISPLKPTDMALIEKMMDEDDGVVNREYKFVKNKNDDQIGLLWDKQANRLVQLLKSFKIAFCEIHRMPVVQLLK